MIVFFQFVSAGKSIVSTFPNFVTKTPPLWQKDSFQFTCRVDAVRDMIIRSGYPVTIVDEPYFKEMTKTLDPKFVLPGKVSSLHSAV